MAKLSRVKIDAKRAVEGVWHTYAEGIEVRVARMFNPNYERVVAELMKPHAKEYRAGRLSNEQMEDVRVQAIARTVLLDWKNVEDDDGQPMPYTPERGLAVLRDPGYVDLLAFISAKAGDWESYRLSVQEDAKGN